MGIRVLLVDDDRDVREVSEAFIERESDRIDLLTEGDPDRALDRLEGVDCVVTDYRMPGTDGTELCRAVTERHPDLPVFVLTAVDDEEVAEEAAAAGAAGVIEKGSGSEFYAALVDRIEGAVDG